jgi:hypothetical protein
MLTCATGTGCTVIVDVPVRPSPVAVTVAVPTPAALAKPLVALTRTRSESEVLHTTVRPVTGAPVESRGSALSCSVDPWKIVAVAGVTTTDVTGDALSTVTVAVPTRPSLVAVMTALPDATPVTSPVAETVTAVGVPEAHVTVRPARTAPAALLVVAVSWAVAPTAIELVGGVTATDDTATGDGVGGVLLPPQFQLASTTSRPAAWRHRARRASGKCIMRYRSRDVMEPKTCDRAALANGR